MTEVGGADIRSNTARLLGRALEDPIVLRSMRATELESVDLHDGDLQAGYALLCHLAQLSRLTCPLGDSSRARTNAATANLRVVSDWTVDRRRDRERRRHACFDQGRPLRYHDDVPSPTDLLLDAAARLNIVWWFNLWELAWPPASMIGCDLEAVMRDRAFRSLSALGRHLYQRGSTRTAEPTEIADDVLARLARIDPTAIGRFLARREQGRSARQVTSPSLPEPVEAPARGRSGRQA